MGIDDQGLCIFTEGAVGSLTGEGHGHAQHDPLAAAAVGFRAGGGRPGIHESKLGDSPLGCKHSRGCGVSMGNDYRAESPKRICSISKQTMCPMVMWAS